MSNGHLIPESRVNKNGVTVVKWIKADKPAPRTREIPRSPGAPPLVIPAWSQLPVPLQWSALSKDRLEDFDSGALTAVDSMLVRNAHSDLAYQADMAAKSAFNAYHDSGYTSQTEFNNLAVFGDAVIRDESQRHQVSALVAGLSYGPPKDYLFDADDEERDNATTLIMLAAQLDDDFLTGSHGYDEPVRIKSDDLAMFALEHPDEIDDIARAVNKRKSDDVDMLREVLGHGQKALREGVL